MMQIGDLQPKPRLFRTPLPAEADKQQQPSRRLPEEEQEPLFVSPPPALGRASFRGYSRSA